VDDGRDGDRDESWILRVRLFLDGVGKEVRL
jgi:hypothetical protein